MQRPVNILDKIGSLIPGYKGYVEREGRRNCDRVLRETLSDKLSKFEKVIVKEINNAINKSEIDTMRRLESDRKDVNTLLSKIRYAPYGASSFFSDQQIKEDELMTIYQFDLDLAESIDLLITIDLSENLTDNINNLENILVKRNQFIKENK
ncbi:MAG: hypothetical protein O3A39_11670 [Proteobacteria bacterium]|nr:hypothetical protein [Pseudomonadota bacterium]